MWLEVSIALLKNFYQTLYTVGAVFMKINQIMYHVHAKLYNFLV